MQSLTQLQRLTSDSTDKNMPRKDSLDPDIIKANLVTKHIGKEIIVYKSTSSTNDVAAEYAKKFNIKADAPFSSASNARSAIRSGVVVMCAA